ncbi:MAG: ATP-dependent zinc metalloprotease FtsH [candidate division Zixibacteria bacterium]
MTKDDLENKGMDNNLKRKGQGSRQPPKGKPPDGDGPGVNWQKTAKTMAFWAVVILLSFWAFNYYFGPGRDTVGISYTELLTQIKSGNVIEVTFEDRKVSGEFKVEFTKVINGQEVTGSKFTSMIPFTGDDKLLELMEENDVLIEARASSNWGSFLTYSLPWLFLIFFWLFMMRQMQGGTKGIFSFGKSKARLLTGSRPKVTFDDVAGCDEAKQELEEIIDFLRDPAKFQKLGGKLPKGALLLGAPGTGKTLLARAIAGEAHVPFFSMSGSDFVEMFVGVGASRVRDLFEQGKRNAPCIIFIDEIDAVGRHRGAGLGGGHDEREQTLNQLLVEMDGFESNEGVILIAATNRPDVLDPALLRPGRFDRQIVVDQPDIKGREGILKVHVKKIKVGDDVDLKILARGTPGMSGADLANLVNEAALLAARKERSAVTMADFEDAKDKVMMGTERRSLVISPEEKKTTAYHEAGHALVAKLIPGSDPVHKVTIIPRGLALGLTHYLPIDERHTMSREYLETKLVHMMGGRVAEKIKFDHLTTGAGNDLKQATNLARKMVCDWGMSEKIGPLFLGSKDDEIFLGRDFVKKREYSEATAEEIDAEVRRIVLEAEKKASGLLTKNTAKLEKLAEALLEKEILDGNEIDEILKKMRTKKAPEAAGETSISNGKEVDG